MSRDIQSQLMNRGKRHALPNKIEIFLIFLYPFQISAYHEKINVFRPFEEK